MSVAWAAYRCVAPAIGALAPHAGIFAPAGERSLWRERMGEVAWDAGCEAWIHAASMGEAVAAGPLARELLALQPQARLRFTSTTRTGRSRLGALGLSAALAPIDAPQIVARFLRRVRPARLLVIETEIWPHWLMAARDANVRVAFVSARLSERSIAGYRRLGAPLRALLEGVGAVLCQSESDAGRWLAIGTPQSSVAVTGNLKFDALPAPAPGRRVEREALGLDPVRPVLTLGSVRPGEARALAGAWSALPATLRAQWQVIAVPRHARALDALREEAGGAAASWRWDARAGVLNAYYAVSDAAFVGASLVPLGGHNPLEPAAVGAAVLMGPFTSHQQAAVDALAARGAIVVAGAPTLGAALERVLKDDTARAVMTAAALDVVASLRGASRRSVAELAVRGLWPVNS